MEIDKIVTVVFHVLPDEHSIRIMEEFLFEKKIPDDTITRHGVRDVEIYYPDMSLEKKVKTCQYEIATSEFGIKLFIIHLENTGVLHNEPKLTPRCI